MQTLLRKQCKLSCLSFQVLPYRLHRTVRRSIKLQPLAKIAPLHGAPTSIHLALCQHSCKCLARVLAHHSSMHTCTTWKWRKDVQDVSESDPSLLSDTFSDILPPTLILVQWNISATFFDLSGKLRVLGLETNQFFFLIRVKTQDFWTHTQNKQTTTKKE